MSIVEKYRLLINAGKPSELAIDITADLENGIYIGWDLSDNAYGSIVDVDNTLEVITYYALEGPQIDGDGEDFVHAIEDEKTEFWWADDVPKDAKIVREFTMEFKSIK